MDGDNSCDNYVFCVNALTAMHLTGTGVFSDVLDASRDFSIDKDLGLVEAYMRA